MTTTYMINNTINANKHNPEVVTDDISDGFHTFGQLYFQRMMLFATLVNLFPEISWKTKRHEDGEECFGGGWFLVTIETPAGNYGYHYEEKYWDMFKCDEIDKAKNWDGYTEENVDRLFSLLAYDRLNMYLKASKPEPFNKRCICDDCIHHIDKDNLACLWCGDGGVSNFEPINKEETND